MEVAAMIVLRILAAPVMVALSLLAAMVNIPVLRGVRRVRAGLHCADATLPDPVHWRADGGRNRVPRPCVPRFALWRSRHR